MFNGIQYSASVANFMNDTNQMPLESWHPRLPNIVYFGMDWLCPGYDQVLYTQLIKYYGNITPENTIQYITPIVQTGDLHIAIYDLTNMILYTANARRSGLMLLIGCRPVFIPAHRRVWSRNGVRSLVRAVEYERCLLRFSRLSFFLSLLAMQIFNTSPTPPVPPKATM